MSTPRRCSPIPLVSCGLGKEGRKRVGDLVHHSEDAVDALLGGVVVFGEGDGVTDHLVDRSHDRQHLVPGDGPVVVKVVQLEGPSKTPSLSAPSLSQAQLTL